MIGSFAEGIASVLDLILNMALLLIMASIIISWVGGDPSNQLVSAIRSMTEPLFRPLRKLTQSFPGPIDWAPMILMLIIVFLQKGVVPMIRMLGTGAATG